MKKALLLSFFCLLLCDAAFAWGREGHETIAKIAENNLRPQVKHRLEKYLGHSIVYYAKWMDEHRHTPEYAFTSPWHGVVVSENLDYLPRPEGDIIYGLDQAVSALKDYRNLPDSTVAVNIKYILHLTGDLHCPVHILYQGRNYDFKVNFGGGYIQPEVYTRVHFVWDYLAIQSCRIWSVSEYAAELDRLSRREIKEITAGTPQDWLRDNAERCLLHMELAHPEETLEEDFVNAAMPLIETQMLYAGYRLAHILNSLF